MTGNATNAGDFMQWSLAIFLMLLELTIIVLIWIGSSGAARKSGCSGINLEKVIGEQDGAASFSRFQFLIFTFIVASAYIVHAFYAIGKGLDLPRIDPSVLGLIGISGGSYLVSKGIETSGNADKAAAPETAAPAGANPPTYG